MNVPHRVLILTPHLFPEAAGNAITAERWRRLLVGRGIAVSLLGTQTLDANRLLTHIEAFSPQIIHVHHAIKAGRFFLDRSIRERCAAWPLVVSLAGTDMASSGHEKEIFCQVLERARAIISQSGWLSDRVLQIMPECRERIHPVVKSVLSDGKAPYDLRPNRGRQESDILFFLPAGIRPVKGNLECLLALEGVHEFYPGLRAVFAGPVLDEAYGKKFSRAVHQRQSFARWLPAIPGEAMPAAYGSADIVLNASFSEGLSNVILEAMVAGRPLLASDIAANRDLINGAAGEDPCGLLFTPGDAEHFKRQALALIEHPSLRASLGRAGRERIVARHRPEDEADGLIGAYQQAMAGTAIDR